MLERRGGGPWGAVEPVFMFLVAWAAGKGVDQVAGFLYRQLRGKVDRIRVADSEVDVEEKALVDALRQAVGSDDGGE